MANGAPAWLTAVPCRRPEGLHDAAPRALGLRDLSTRDRREVVSIAAAGLATAMCVLVTGTFEGMPDRMLAARPLNVAIAAAPQPPRASAVLLLNARGVPTTTRRASRSSTSSSDRPMLVASNAVDPVAPTVASRRPINQYHHYSRARYPYTQAEVGSDAAMKGPGSLKRVLFGSGQYRVQPFPTVSEQEN